MDAVVLARIARLLSYLNTKWPSRFGRNRPHWPTRIVFLPFYFMFFSPVALSHRHNDWLALDTLWQNASSDLSSYPQASDPPRRSFQSVPALVPILPYSDPFSRRSPFAMDDVQSSRSLIFDPIYSSPSYTLSAAISSPPASTSTTTASPPSAPPLLPPPPPPSSCSPHTSPSSSPPSSPDCHPRLPPSLPSVHAFRLDTLQSVDPSDDPCPLSLHDLMIPSEEQEYQGHSYHFSLQSVSPPNAKPQSFSDEKPPHEESALPKRKGKSKMHTCALCQKSFPRPSGLRTHMNSHSGDKRVSCVVLHP